MIIENGKLILGGIDGGSLSIVAENLSDSYVETTIDGTKVVISLKTILRLYGMLEYGLNRFDISVEEFQNKVF